MVDVGTQRAKRLCDDVGDAPARVQARIRILENHLHAAARAPQRRRIRRRAFAGDNVSAVANDAARGCMESDDQPRDRRFAATRFADEPERFTAVERKIDAIDGLQHNAILAFEQPIEPRRRHVEVARDVD